MNASSFSERASLNNLEYQEMISHLRILLFEVVCHHSLRHVLERGAPCSLTAERSCVIMP